ncbi:hypothetical protein DQ04_02971010 [Trypanosoma grayi]|uniref:hypothetical protein n=1 Tax=Trypanosoma grayi TaxID=71804 RepID=UPI0004F474BC|nr:hypothetical protein DQ04_02971010 [Trypanosoma grayi]KEG11107.1 hypothetical protein DQ04_02971010 [Trypanosoma grayi]
MSSSDSESGSDPWCQSGTQSAADTAPDSTQRTAAVATAAARAKPAPASVQRCCFVFDTSSLLETDILRRLQVEAQRHLLILPTKVYEELKSKSNQEGDEKARRILDLINQENQKQQNNNSRGRRRGDGDSDGRPEVGLRLQKSKEKWRDVIKASRNNDDHILACACYFSHLLEKTPTYLVTEDIVLALKAHAEGVLVEKTIR